MKKHIETKNFSKKYAFHLPNMKVKVTIRLLVFNPKSYPALI